MCTYGTRIAVRTSPNAPTTNNSVASLTTLPLKRDSKTQQSCAVRLGSHSNVANFCARERNATTQHTKHFSVFRLAGACHCWFMLIHNVSSSSSISISGSNGCSNECETNHQQHFWPDICRASRVLHHFLGRTETLYVPRLLLLCNKDEVYVRTAMMMSTLAEVSLANTIAMTLVIFRLFDFRYSFVRCVLNAVIASHWPDDDKFRSLCEHHKEVARVPTDVSRCHDNA